MLWNPWPAARAIIGMKQADWHIVVKNVKAARVG